MDQNEARRYADSVLELAVTLGASYADVRFTLETVSESIDVHEENIEVMSRGTDSGAGIRVLLGGAWGFAGFSDLKRTPNELSARLKRATLSAARLARASSKLRSFPLELAPIPGALEEAHYATPYKTDPLTLPMADKVGLLMDLSAGLKDPAGLVKFRGAGFEFGRGLDFFASYEEGVGTRYITEFDISCALSLSALAFDGDETQRRTLAFDGYGSAAGYEYVEGLDLDALVTRLRTEAVELITAKDCKPGRADIIVMPEQLGLHVHETGHAFEGDRLMGYEQTYIGSTFIGEILAEMGEYEFASPAVNLTADTSATGGYGSFGHDDEGVPGQSFYLVEGGIIKNVLTSRETVRQINTLIGRDYFAHSNGTMRASGYDRMPLIRMTNVSLAPGSGSLDELIAGVEHGYLVYGNYSWSMSEDRKLFDFGNEYAVEINSGRLGAVVKNFGYRGSNLTFWKSCEHVCGPEESFMLNVPNCGKGQPGQSMATGHATSPALFKNVEVYNRKENE